MNKTVLVIIGLVLLLLAALLITIGAYVRKDHDNAGWWTIVIGMMFLSIALLFLLTAIIYHPTSVNVKVAEVKKE